MPSVGGIGISNSKGSLTIQRPAAKYSGSRDPVEACRPVSVMAIREFFDTLDRIVF